MSVEFISLCLQPDVLEEPRGRNKADLREADLEPLDYDLDISREVQTGLTLVLVVPMVQSSLLHCVCRSARDEFVMVRFAAVQTSTGSDPGALRRVGP